VPAGHTARHWPPCSFGAWAGHERHALDPLPLHVAQLLSQSWQMAFVSEYVPSLQTATQLEPCLLGVAVAHISQSAAVPPVHVPQVESHA